MSLKGMALKLNYYLVHEARHLLALLSERHGVFSVANRFLFSTPVTAWFGCPLLKLGAAAVAEGEGRTVNITLTPYRFFRPAAGCSRVGNASGPG